VSFTKEAHDWEVNVFASFFQILHLVIVKRGSEDKLWWVPSKKCLFKVKIFSSFFQILHSIIVKRGCEDKLWWVPSKKCLLKVKTFFSLFFTP